MRVEYCTALIFIQTLTKINKNANIKIQKRSFKK